MAVARIASGFSVAGLSTLVALSACREHRSVCEAAPCLAVAPSEGGAEGAAPTLGAGATQEPDCRRDRDCRDDSRCDGLEVCVEGTCQEGEAVSCEHGTVCVEAGAEPCVYSEPSPWLVAMSFDTLYGLPVAEIARGRELAVLEDRPRSQLLNGFAEMSWAPSGRAALVLSYEPELGSRRELLRFGAGATATLVPAPNVPTWGEFQTAPDFAGDSSRALVYDDYSGIYLVDLRDDPEPTRLVAPSGAYSTASFCAGSSAWLAGHWQASNLVVIADVVEGEVIERPIGYGVAEASPDERSFALTQFDADSGELIGVKLGACSMADEQVVDLPDIGLLAFSPDSSALLASPSSGGLKVMSLTHTAQPVELWSSPTAVSVEEKYFAREQLLLVLYGEGDAEPSLHVVDASQGVEAKPTWLGLPPSAVVEVLGTSALLAWVSHTDGEGRDLYWQSLPPKSDPVLVSSSPGEDDVQVLRLQGEPGSRLVRRIVGSEEVQSQISLLRFDREQFEPELPLVTLPGVLVLAATASADAGIAMLQASGSVAFAASLWWVPGPGEQASAPRLLAEEIVGMELQPWR